MARIENTRMTVSLDAESKRIIKNLTKAIDNLSRVQRHVGRVEPGSPEDSRTKRLVEPAENRDEDDYLVEEYTSLG